MNREEVTAQAVARAGNYKQWLIFFSIDAVLCIVLLALGGLPGILQGFIGAALLLCIVFIYDAGKRFRWQRQLIEADRHRSVGGR